MRHFKLSLNPMSIAISALSLSLLTNVVYADDFVEFQQIEPNRMYAKAVCYSSRAASSSETVKHVDRYEAYLNPRQLKAVLTGRQVFEFERLSNLAMVKIRGRDAHAMVSVVEIAVQIKSVEGEVFSTTMLQWNSEVSEGLRDNKRAGLKMEARGATDCATDDPNKSSKVCRYDASLDLNAEVSHVTHQLKRHYQENPRQGVIIEVLHRREARVDCSGKYNAAYIRGMSYEPLLILRDLD